MTERNIITNVTREQVADMVAMRERGLTGSNIATRAGYNDAQVRRYLRVYDQYGIEAFVPNQ